MGDLRACSPEPRALFSDDRLLTFPPPPNPNPEEIGVAQWARAEQTVHEIICEVQPTEVSEERRKAVVDYVQRLIRCRVGCEVRIRMLGFVFFIGIICCRSCSVQQLVFHG